MKYAARFYLACLKGFESKQVISSTVSPNLSNQKDSVKCQLNEASFQTGHSATHSKAYISFKMVIVFISLYFGDRFHFERANFKKKNEREFLAESTSSGIGYLFFKQGNRVDLVLIPIFDSSVALYDFNQGMITYAERIFNRFE